MDLGDIEDLISSPNDQEPERLQFDHVIARVKKVNGTTNGRATNKINKKEYKQNQAKLKASKANRSADLPSESEPAIDESISYVPGQATIFVKTYGCTHNDSDAQYMAGQLKAYGYTITNEEKDAQVWLLNSCTVKGPAEQLFRNYVEKGLKNGKRIVVSGCVSQAAPNSKYLANISIVGVQQIDRVVEVVEETLQGRTVRLLGVRKKENGTNKKKLVSLNLPKIRRNELVEIISINVGCLNECTYCKTKHARGELASYTMKEITDRAAQSIAEGVAEIWLTSEDTGTYGRDLEPDPITGLQPNLPNLLRSVLSVMPSNCRLRLGMSNPPYIKEHIVELARIMQEDSRFYKFLHIPVQNASNEVLEDMKREYTIEDFQYIVDEMRRRVPGITIATDLILGFPTETEKDFEATVQLVERNKFPSLFINQFYPRPGTPAARMDLIPAKDVKKRTKRMTEIFHSYQPYSNRVGRKYSVLVTETSFDRQFFVGHNEFYEQVLVPKRDEYMGKIIEVEIRSFGKFFMVGRPLNEPVKSKRILDLFKLDPLLSVTAAVGLIGLTILLLKLKK